MREHLSGAASLQSGPPAPAPRSHPRRQVRLWHAVAGLAVIALGVAAGPPLYATVLQRLNLLPLPAAKRIAVLPIHNRALAMAPDNARIWSDLGGTYYLEGRKAEAETAFGKSVALYPTSIAVSNLAALQFYRKDYGGAVRTFEQAIKVSDLDYRVWRNLASAYYWAPGQRDRASGAYKRAADLAERERLLDPRSASLLVALADCRAMTRDGVPARALLTDALTLAPADVQVLKMAAGVYETLGDRTEALQWLDMALAGGFPRPEVDNSIEFEALRRDPRYAAIGERAPAKTGDKGGSQLRKEER